MTYSRLLLATGSSPRPAGVPGEDLVGVVSLQTLHSADRLHESLTAAAQSGVGRLVVIGDGWTGFEVAASARALGVAVTFLGHGTQPLGNVLGERMGAFYAGVHTQHGVSIRKTIRVMSINGSAGLVTGVTSSDGSVIDASVVLIAAGADANVNLAASARIALQPRELGGGIAVDHRLATSAPDFYAAGDVASIPSPVFDRPLRAEHWDTALHTGPPAGMAMLGDPTPFDRLPYFYSDQFNISMEYTGFSGSPAAFDEVIISGFEKEGDFVAFWMHRGRVQAGMTVNSRDRTRDRRHDPLPQRHPRRNPLVVSQVTVPRDGFARKANVLLGALTQYKPMVFIRWAFLREMRLSLRTDTTTAGKPSREVSLPGLTSRGVRYLTPSGLPQVRAGTPGSRRPLKVAPSRQRLVPPATGGVALAKSRATPALLTRRIPVPQFVRIRDNPDFDNGAGHRVSAQHTDHTFSLAENET